MKLTEQELSRISTLVLKGYKFAHREDCTSPHICPKECACAAHNNLDLDTAIAWFTARYLSNLTTTERVAKQGVLTTLSLVEGYLTVVAQHADKYKPLYFYLVETVSFLNQLIRR